MGSPLEQLPFRRVGEVQLMSVLQDSPYILACSGYQHNLERRVFIKLLKPHLAGEHHLVRRFHKEGQICANLQHPGIVRVFQLGQEQEYHFIIQEFVEGKSLQDLLRDSHPLPDGVIGHLRGAGAYRGTV